jgi:hypothetical protein
MPDPTHVAERVAEQITAAFTGVEYPGDWRLVDSSYGTEPLYVEQDFKGKGDWRALAPAFLDLAPDGLASALSFFSDEAFRFYLPAYLVADVRGQLERVHPVFYLTHGLDDSSRGELIEPRLLGRRTWFDEKRHRFSVFRAEEASAIVAYLVLKRDSDESSRQMIDQALQNYWNERAA